MFSFSNIISWIQNEDVESNENHSIENQIGTASPCAMTTDQHVLWGILRNWFSKSESKDSAPQEQKSDPTAPALYDKLPLGISLSLVQPQVRQIQPEVNSNERGSNKRGSVYSLGSKRPSERARLILASYVPPGFKVPFDFEKLQTDDDDGTLSSTEHLGRLQLSTIYLFTENTLVLRINKAFDLPAMDLSGTSDPFVKCCLLPDRKRKLETKVRRKTLNPVWNETLSFEGLAYEKIQQRVLYLQVMDYDRFSRNDPIGEVYIPLHTINLAQERVAEHPLMPCKRSNKRGELLLSLSYQPIEGILDVEIEKARNLKPMDLRGTSDPYVKVWLMYRNKRVEKKKTEVMKNSLNPVFGEMFTFNVSIGQLRDIQLQITVMDYDSIGRNEVIGKIYLGHKSTGLEKQHWKDMLSKPKDKMKSDRKQFSLGAVSQWHVLRV